MTFVSYAQNAEDVMLNRALSSIKRGFYIDVGAGDPTTNSISKAFYLAGWSGINVEPIPDRHKLLSEQRTRDTNLPVVCADADGEVRFFIVENHDELSTIDHDAIASLSSDRIAEITVPSETLASICYRHVEGPIHFLKIDVEGAELRVLAGADFAKFRPWIIVIETFSSGREDHNREQINVVLADASYTYAYFDGLNEFFVADEHLAELTPAFAYPPCGYRDNFITSNDLDGNLARFGEYLEATSLSDESEIFARLKQLRRDRIDLAHEVQATRDDVERLEGENTDLQRSLREEKAQNERLWQRSFERERYIAWQSSEIVRLRHTTIQRVEVARRAFITSVSWRVTLPLRILRHPVRYLRHLRDR